MNPILNALGGNGPQLPADMQSMITAFNQFRTALKGNPEQQVKALMASGKMTQNQYNQLAQMAQSMMQYFS